MNSDLKKKEVMKKILAKKGKGGPGSGGAGEYAIDDPTKAEANLEGCEYKGQGGPGSDFVQKMGLGAKVVGQRIGDAAYAAKGLLNGKVVEGAVKKGVEEGTKAYKMMTTPPISEPSESQKKMQKIAGAPLGALAAGLSGVSGAGVGAVKTLGDRYKEARSNDIDQEGTSTVKSLGKVLSPGRFSSLKTTERLAKKQDIMPLKKKEIMKKAISN